MHYALCAMYLAILACSLIAVTFGHDTRYAFRQYCTRPGQYFVHPHNRCQYVYCTYQRTRYSSGLFATVRQCPPGTAVSRGQYSSRRVQHPMYHPLAICTDRIYAPVWATGTCSVTQMKYRLRPAYTYKPRPKPMAFHYPMKHFYRPKNKIVRMYNGHKINKDDLITTTEMPIMLNDMSDDITSRPIVLNDIPDDIITPIESKMAAKVDTISEPIYQNDLEGPVTSEVKKIVIPGVNDYQMDPEEEAEILKSLHKLLPVEQPEILSEEESNKVKQEMMQMIFGGL